MHTENAAAVVQQAQQSEQQLINRAIEAKNDAYFIIGECASLWCQQYANGRTDQDFADLIGIDRSTVNRARNVCETFSVCATSHKLSYSHYVELLAHKDQSEDAKKLAKFVSEMGMSVRETRRYVQTLNRQLDGEDLTKPAEDDQPEESPEEEHSYDGDDDLKEDGKPMFPNHTEPTPAEKPTAFQEKPKPAKRASAAAATEEKPEAQTPDWNSVLDALNRELPKTPEHEREMCITGIITACKAVDADLVRTLAIDAPDLEDVKTYVQIQGITIDPEHYYDARDAIGWVDKQNRPIVNWRADIKTWHRNVLKFQNSSGNSKMMNRPKGTYENAEYELFE